MITIKCSFKEREALILALDDSHICWNTSIDLNCKESTSCKQCIIANINWEVSEDESNR